MKKKLLFLSIPILVLISCTKGKNESPVSPVPSDTLSTGWKKIQINDSTYFDDVFFVNNTGFAVGRNIYKSSDGGDNWTKPTSPAALGAAGLLSIGMGNEKNAIFVSTFHQLIATHNGGASFITNAMPDPSLSDVFFVDSSIAFAVGKSLWKTIDGGDNWIKVYDFAPTHGWNSLSFINERTGFISNQEGIYKTINGGMDWQRLNTDTISLVEGGAIFFLNSDTGYISNNISIQRTLDGGASWNKVFSCAYSTYHDIHFVSPTVGYITDGPRIFKTSDGGNTWTKVVALGGGSILDTLIELHFTDENHGWACGGKGTVLKFNQ
jgi:photosystem II stability/assembly factor-like uncharacterized protein